MSERQLNASELDEYLVAETAYDKAIASGKSKTAALAAAKDAITAKRKQRATDWVSSLGRPPRVR